MVFSVLCQLARLLRAQTCHLCFFFPVTDERSGRTPMWACQRMGLPSSLSGVEKEIQTGSVLCWWKHKTFVTPFLCISCAFCLFYTPINLETEAEGLKDHAAATCAFPQPCTWCQSPVQCWCLRTDGSSLTQSPCTLPGWQTHPHVWFVTLPLLGKCAIVKDNEACLRWYLLKQPWNPCIHMAFY